MKLINIIGIIFIASSLIIAAFLYIISFLLWYNLLGFVGLLIAVFFVPDLILLVIRIIQHGFFDWYFLSFVGATVLYYFGMFIHSKEEKEIKEVKVKKQKERSEVLKQVNVKNDIGGWLLLFIINITFLSPLLTIFSLTSSINQILPFINEYPGLFTLSAIDTIASIGLTAFGIYAGIRLILSKHNAVKTAKKYLSLYLIYGIIILILPNVVGLPTEAIQAMYSEILKSSLKAIVFFVIWFIYLSKSKRVYNTYSQYLNKKSEINEMSIYKTQEFIKCEILAMQGNAYSQYMLGLRYENGKGIEKDNVKAIYWYKKAAEQGNSAAQFALYNKMKANDTVDTKKANNSKTVKTTNGNVLVVFLGVCILLASIIISGSLFYYSYNSNKQREDDISVAALVNTTTTTIPTTKTTTTQTTTKAATTTIRTTKHIRKTYFTIGSTKEDVREAMGTPDTIAGDSWFYEYSNVNFDYSTGLVVGYGNSSNNLKVR